MVQEGAEAARPMDTARCEAGVRIGGRQLEGSKGGTDRNGKVYPALLVEYDGVLAFFPRVCCVF